MHKLTQSANHLSNVTLQITLGIDRLLHTTYDINRDNARRETKRHLAEAQAAMDVIRRELEEYSP